MKYRVRGPLFVVYRPLLAIGCAWSRPSEGPAWSGPVLRSITAHRPRATDPGQPATSLPLVLALAQPFENGEPCFFGVGNGDRFQFRWRIEAGDDLAYRLFAGRTLGQWGRAQGPPQSELAAADLALAVAQFVFVEGHGTRRNLRRTPGQPTREPGAGLTSRHFPNALTLSGRRREFNPESCVQTALGASPTHRSAAQHPA